MDSCFNCKTLTSQNILLQTFHKENYLYEFYIHTCGLCKRNLNQTILNI